MQMIHRYRAMRAIGFWLLSLRPSIALSAAFTPARVAVYFAPNGGATEAVVREINAATQQILVQA
jgi:hypothetical protein